MDYLELKFAIQFVRLKRRQQCEQTDDADTEKRSRRSHLSSPDVLEMPPHHSDIDASPKFMPWRFIHDAVSYGNDGQLSDGDLLRHANRYVSRMMCENFKQEEVNENLVG